MNKAFLIIALLLCLPICLLAQTERSEIYLPQDSLHAAPITPHAQRDTTLFYPSLPAMDYFTFSPLHAGLNTSLSMFASVGFGSHSPKGVGFGKNINLTYAQPLKGKWSYALGANINDMKWGGYQWRQATVGGEINYACNDRLSFSVMGYKELVHPNTLMPYYYNYSDPLFMNRDSYVGGAINMKVTDNFFFQVSFGTGTLRDR